MTNTHKRLLNSMSLFKIHAATVVAILCTFTLASAASTDVTLTHRWWQNSAGQNFTFTFYPVELSNGTNGTFTIHARGDYSVPYPKAEFLTWDIDALVCGVGAPDYGTVISEFMFNDVEWEQSFTVNGAVLSTITSDSSITISVDLSDAVDYQINPTKHFVEVELTYTTEDICPPPPEPNNPDPCDGATDVPVDTYLSWGEECSASCNLPNGGFESGVFAPWTTVTGLGSELTPWDVTSGGTGWFLNGFPLEGAFFAQNGFDGEAGLFYDIYQEVPIPICATSAVLNWSERIQWDIGGKFPRQYVVSVQPAGGGGPLAVLYTRYLFPGTNGDTGYVPHSIDLLTVAPSIAGQTVRINFHEYIPETYTGPAQFDLDGISLSCNGETLLCADTPHLTPQLSESITVDLEALSAEYTRIREDALAASAKKAAEYEYGNNTLANTDGDIQKTTAVSSASVVSSTSGQIINGDFETGDFSGWTLVDTGNGTFVINDGTYNPRSPDGPLPPYSGNFSALSDQSGPGIHTIYQDVTLPPDAVTITLHWADMIRNHADKFHDPDQEFRVQIWNTSNQVLKTLFSTNPGNPPFGDWTERSVGISQFAGMTIRIAFTEEDNLGFFNVHLDDIRIELDSGCPTTWDVYFGTDPCSLQLLPECNEICEPTCDPTPNPGDELDPDTKYYWYVVVKNRCGDTSGPLWSFTTVVINQDPNCSDAVPSVTELWPPNHKWVNIEILGVTDPDGDPVSITITGITQDEPVASPGSGKTCPDGDGIGTSVARIRAERSGLGNGRVYEISFEADDGMGGVCSGTVNVCVPHDQRQGRECVDDGQLYNSTATEVLRADLNNDGVINQLDFAILANYWLISYELDN